MEGLDYDVVVVGAGLAGLRTTQLLVQQGLSVLCLEANNCVGGRTRSAVREGYRWDVGGQWLGPTQTRMLNLCSELGLATFPQYTEGKKWVDVLGKKKTYTGTIPPLTIASLIDIQLGIWKIDALAKTVPKGRPQDCPNAREWDNMTVETWKHQNLWTDGAKAMWDIGVRAVYSSDPAELSFLFFLHYIHCAGGYMVLLDTENGAQETRIRGSAHGVALKLAEQLGEQVRLASPVTSIHQTASNAAVTIQDGSSYTCHRVIITVPPLLTNRIEFEPALPTRRRHLAQRMPMGQVIKCLVFYDRPFWRDSGFAGEVVTDGEGVSISFDASLPDIEQYALVAFFDGNPARQWSEKTKEERRAEVVRTFVNYFGDEAAHPIDYLEQDWCSEPWVLGGYTGLMGPGVLTTCGETLTAPFGRIHWAGTETATSWPGYMEGAVQSAERVTDEVLSALAGNVIEYPPPATLTPPPRGSGFPIGKTALALAGVSLCVGVMWAWDNKFTVVKNVVAFFVV